MQIRRRWNTLGVLGLATILLASTVYVWRKADAPVQNLPDRFTDSEYWSLINEFSEPGGYFRSDNFISNETTFQYVIPELQKKVKTGGVYLGVGPDQNFSYIAPLHPKLAIITDIRRQNMLLHLVYKALFEMSAN